MLSANSERKNSVTIVRPLRPRKWHPVKFRFPQYLIRWSAALLERLKKIRSSLLITRFTEPIPPEPEQTKLQFEETPNTDALLAGQVPPEQEQKKTLFFRLPICWKYRRTIARKSARKKLRLPPTELNISWLLTRLKPKYYLRCEAPSLHASRCSPGRHPVKPFC